MKKVVCITALLLSTNAMAGSDWIWPAAIGGVIGYEIGRPRLQPQVIYQQPQVVYVQPQQIYVYPANVPVPYSMRCELRSINFNGQIITNNYCSY